jgi:hypothetical protein
MCYKIDTAKIYRYAPQDYASDALREGNAPARKSTKDMTISPITIRRGRFMSLRYEVQVTIPI